MNTAPAGSTAADTSYASLLQDLESVATLQKSTTTDKAEQRKARHKAEDERLRKEGKTDEEIRKARKTREDAEAEEDARAAAAAKNGGKGEGGGEGGGNGGGTTLDDDDIEMFGKSLSVTLEGGEQATVLDGDAVVSGFRFLKAQNTELARALADEKDARARDRDGNMQVLSQMTKSLQALQSQMNEFGAQGRGRQSVVSVLSKGMGAAAPAGGGAPAGMSPAEIQQKTLVAMQKGRLGAAEVAEVERRLNAGQELPAPFLKALSEV